MIALACDHTGIELKKEMMKLLDSMGLEWKDFGTDTAVSCDYPVYGYRAAKAVASGECAALIFDTTSEIAMATSVLYLVPGVPLINGVIDVVEGYVLTGFARLTEASLLIVSIAIGLSFTLLMVKNSLI